VSRKVLKIPIPWGHQPHTPPDDPFSAMVAERLGEGKPERDDCLADFSFRPRHPTRPCLLGQRSECAWGVQDRRANFCMWLWIDQNPDGPETQPKMAAALGQSRERIKSICDEGMVKARAAAGLLSLPQLY
jgi:hypothetical protein